MSGPEWIRREIAAQSVAALPQAEASCHLAAESLERLMPLHLVVGMDGRIIRAARTLRKLFAEEDLVDRNFFEVFEPRRPRGLRDVGDMLKVEGGRLSLAFRAGPQRHLKAVLVSLSGVDGVLINLSFGYSLVEAVRDHDLTAGDFAGTDLAVEMLYLVEAKSAALYESKKLNLHLQGAKVAAEEQAFTDTLTGLKNRRAMHHVLERLTSEKVSFGLLQLDLDYFKQVNDTHGHAAGDRVLQSVAGVLVNETRDRDTVARVGGDEFVIILVKLVDERVLTAIANRIIARLEQPIAYGDNLLRISASVGVTTSEHQPHGAVDDLLAAADLALYASKRAGRGCASVAPRCGEELPAGEIEPFRDP